MLARRWSYRALVGWLILVAVLLVLWWTAPSLTPPPGAEDSAGVELLEARVARVSTAPTAAPDSSPRRIVHLEVLSGSLRGERITIELLPEGRSPGVLQYRPGDRVNVSYVPAAVDCVGQPDSARARDGRLCSKIRGVPPFVIDDFARRVPLLVLGVVFVIALALVAGWQGLRSLAGMVCALGVLRWFVVPHILAGREPLLIAMIGCVLIVAVALPLTQSDFAQVVAAGLGLLGGVVVASALSVLFVSAARIGGWGTSEELLLVQVLTGGVVSVRGLLLASMLIGAIGALIDAAAGQASSVFELHAADRTAPLWQLYRRGMKVGRVHIGAMVNTLVIAYAGASLPVIVLLTLYQGEIGDVWNREDIAVEIVRSLVGSLGILVAVPLTTWAAAAICRWRARVSHPPAAAQAPDEGEGVSGDGDGFPLSRE